MKKVMGKRSLFFKTFFPLIAVFVVAAIFFVSYNHFLLDRTLINLKISLDKTTNIKEAKGLASILGDAFLQEFIKNDLDASTLAELEFSKVVSEEITDDAQLADLRFFLEKVVGQKQKDRLPILKAVDNIWANLFPVQKIVDRPEIEKKVKKLKRRISLSQGRHLQKVYLEIAGQLVLISEFQEAVSYIDKVLEINPDNLLSQKARLQLGVIYKAQGKFDKAREVFASLEDKLPADLSKFSQYQTAASLYAQGHYQQAAEVFGKMFKQNPAEKISQLSKYRAGLIYLDKEDDPHKAQEVFSELKQKAPGSKDTTQRVGLAAQRCDQAGFDYLAEGYKSLRESNFKKALDMFDFAIQLNPKNGRAYSGKAIAYHYLKNDGESLLNAKKAKDLSPDNPAVYSNTGFIYYRLGMIDKAISDYKKAVEIDSKRGLDRYNLGTLYLFKKKYELASRQLKKAEDLAPNLAYIYNNRAYSLWADGKYAQARVLLNRAIFLKPDYKDAYYNLGVVLYTVGNYEEARTQFLKVKENSEEGGYKKTNDFLKKIKNKLGY
ncbi:MAG: tetratricopeptide repeat protein [Candidatus Omnitrophica bacterium]|nr:tetratricopeptide repeat protein [Candidatus Omnitrophota bacterium]